MKQLLVAAGLLSAVSFARADIYEFDLWTGLLTGGNEVPPNASTATGGEVGAGLIYDDVTNQLEVNIAYGFLGYKRLEGDYDGSHLHLGPIGSNGPVVVDLSSAQISLDTTYGFYEGTVTIPQEYEAALMAGDIYMNIHTLKFQGGEIRSQLLVVPEPGTLALLALGGAGLFFVRRRRS